MNEASDFEQFRPPGPEGDVARRAAGRCDPRCTGACALVRGGQATAGNVGIPIKFQQVLTDTPAGGAVRLGEGSDDARATGSRRRPAVNSAGPDGFALIELAVVLVIMGLMLSFAIPSVHGLTESQRLKGATRNIADQLRVARMKAIATGVDQTMSFALNTPSGTDFDYRVSSPASLNARWALPKGITYYSIGINPTMKKDGRASASGAIVLRDLRGNRDTVRVLLSGLVQVR